MTLRVNEIFYSIQGESSFAGKPCVFIRLTGCNLRCSYCDTRYAYHEGVDYQISAIVARIASFNCPLVEVTGGEPLIQADTPMLLSKLIQMGYEVLVETNGSQDISKIHEDCIKIIDIKCPSSGEAEKNDLKNLARLTDKDEIKFVIGCREDYEYAKRILDITAQDFSKIHPIHFSPVFGRLSPETLAKWILEDRTNVFLHLQLHKIIWDPERRGV